MFAPLRMELTDPQSKCAPEPFQTILPQIRRQAAIKLRHLRAEAREEFVAEVVARAYSLGAGSSSRGAPKSPARLPW